MEGFPTVFKEEHNKLYLVSLKNGAISRKKTFCKVFLLFMLGGDWTGIRESAWPWMCRVQTGQTTEEGRRRGLRFCSSPLQPPPWFSRRLGRLRAGGLFGTHHFPQLSTCGVKREKCYEWLWRAKHNAVFLGRELWFPPKSWFPTCCASLRSIPHISGYRNLSLNRSRIEAWYWNHYNASFWHP